jgi:hypothetical protein
MFGKILLTTLALEAASVAAFPHMAEAVAAQRLSERGLPICLHDMNVLLTSLLGIAPVAPFPEYPGVPEHATYNKFDPASQLVSTSGEHAWIAPGPGDIRGPCAGLNAAANHGYLVSNRMFVEVSLLMY